MRGHDVFLKSLAAHGVDRIFGNPGTTESPLLDSLADHPQMQYIVHLHEGVAVGAAGYYARATGRTAVANLHVAPGLGNAIGMIYNALKGQAPLIVTAGQQDTRMLRREPQVPGLDVLAQAVDGGLHEMVCYMHCQATRINEWLWRRHLCLFETVFQLLNGRLRHVSEKMHRGHRESQSTFVTACAFFSRSRSNSSCFRSSTMPSWIAMRSFSFLMRWSLSRITNPFSFDAAWTLNVNF